MNVHVCVLVCLCVCVYVCVCRRMVKSERMGDRIPTGAESRKNRMLNCDNDTLPLARTQTYIHKHAHAASTLGRVAECRAGQGDHK